jgi:hypothetical protein
MTQTVITLQQLMDYKRDGFIQFDLFPEELEDARREQMLKAWTEGYVKEPTPSPAYFAYLFRKLNK